MAYGQQWGAYPGQMDFYAPQYQQQTYQPMPAQQMMQQSQQMQQQSRQQPVTVRMVASREEAVAAQIPFDGTINVFVNVNAREVYIKRFNMTTGNADFDDYLRRAAQPEAPKQQDAPPEWATAAALEETRRRLDDVAAEMEALRASMSKKVKKGAQEDE